MIQRLRHSDLRKLTAVLTVGLFCVLMAGTENGWAQQPDRNGWSAGIIVPNQPVSLSEQIPVTKKPTAKNFKDDRRNVDRISEDIRSQIGLASFESEVARNPSDEIRTELALPGAVDSPATPVAANSRFLTDFVSSQTEQLTSRDGVQSSLKIAILLAALSLAPALILMTTCYIRVVVVLTLLKQAFGGQQLPPTQVLTALSLFLTFLIMSPVWNEVKTEAIDPYSQTGSTLSWNEAWQRGVVPIRNFMIRQIEMADNAESVAVFYKYLPDVGATPPTELSDVPTNVLLPAFMISELKVAFLLGFQVFLPFLVLDLVVSSVTVSMGMMMLPPNMVSFPLKLILFVMVDGWNLVIGMLLQSFGS